MTSPLPRKLQTIQWSTPRPNKRRIAKAILPVLLCSLALEAAYGDEPPAARRQSIEAVDQLEQLRTRSPESRWKAISRRLNPAEWQPTRQPVARQAAPAPENNRPAPGSNPFLPERSHLFNVSRAEAIGGSAIERVALQSRSGYERSQSGETITSPEQMKKVTDIKPYFDYEPDPTLASEDPCKNLCPRPEGMPACEGDSSQICPEEVQLASQPFQPRVFSESLFQWEASNLWHQPLYFEDPSLERYGHTHHELVQPFVSVGRFGLQLVGLPYQSVIDPYDCRVYTLGWYRPGDHAPRKYYQIPWNTDAALYQAAVTTGMFYIFP